MENKEIKQRFVDEKNGLEYIRVGDYFIPNLRVTTQLNNTKLGKYGRMRLRYLKEHRKAEYLILLMEDKLGEHLREIDITATNRYQLLLKQFAEKENITEELKVKDQLEWVSKMNNIKNRIEEIIFNELIYV